MIWDDIRSSIKKFTLYVWHHHVVWLIAAQMKQVYVRIEADEADQCSCVARYLIEHLQDRLRHYWHVAQRMGVDRAVEHEQVGGRLRRSDHVLNRRHVLDGRMRQFRL